MKLVIPSYLNIYYEPHLGPAHPDNEKAIHFSQLIEWLERCCLELKIPSIELDFRQVQDFTSAASTVLFAYINHLQRISQTKFIFKFDKKSKVYNKLKLLETAIKADSENKLQTLEDKFHPWQSGCVASAKIKNIINYFDQLRSSLKLSQSALNTLSLLQTAIYEALMNVQDHAYLGEKAHFEKRWWQMLWCTNREKGVLINFIIYDVGVGIVKSYQHHNQRGINPMLRNADDILRDAVKLGNSRSGELERGNGLYEMFRPLEQKRVALWMYSNNVLLRKVPSKQLDDCRSIPLRLPGTLIEWTFSLE